MSAQKSGGDLESRIAKWIATDAALPREESRARVRRESANWGRDVLGDLCLAVVDAGDLTQTLADEECRRGRPGLGPLPEHLQKALDESDRLAAGSETADPPRFPGPGAARPFGFAPLGIAPWAGLNDDELRAQSQAAMERWEVLQRVVETALGRWVFAASEDPAGAWASEELGSEVYDALFSKGIDPNLSEADAALICALGNRLLNCRESFVERMGAWAPPDVERRSLRQGYEVTIAMAQHLGGRSLHGFEALVAARCWTFGARWAARGRITCSQVIRNLEGWKPSQRILMPALSEAWCSRDRGLLVVMLNMLATGLWKLGSPAVSGKLREASLEIARLAGGRVAEGKTCGGMGGHLFWSGSLSEAEKSYRGAVEIFRELGDRRLLGSFLNNTAMACYAQGRPKEAEDLYREALEVIRDAGTKRSECLVLIALGVLLGRTGAAAEAREIFQEVWDISRAEGNRTLEPIAIVNFAAQSSRLGMLERATEAYETALSLYRACGDRRGELLTLLSIATADYDRERLVECEERTHEVVRLAEEVQDRRVLAEGLLQLGDCYRRTARVEAAEHAYRRALVLIRDSGHRGEEGRALVSLAAIDLERGNVERALAYARRGREIPLALGDVNDLWPAEYQLAQCLARAGRPAVAAYGRAVEALEVWVGGIGADVARAAVMDSGFALFQEAVAHLLETAAADSSSSRSHEEQAFALAERGKARSLQQSIHRQHHLEPVSPEISKRRSELERRLRVVQNLLLKERSSGRASPDRIRALEEDQARVRKEHGRLLEDIALRFPIYAAEEALCPPLGIEAVQAKIVPEEGSALLEYFVTRDEVYVWVIRSDRWRVVRLGCDEKELTSWIAPIAEALDEGARAVFRVFPRELRRIAQGVLDPVLPLVGDCARLFVVPSGVLHELPFEMLVLRLPGEAGWSGAGGGRFGAPEYAVERFEFSYGPSASLLDPWIGVDADSPPELAGPPGAAPIPLLALGAPGGRSELASAGRKAGAAGPVSEADFASLPGARRELAYLNRLFPEGRIFSGRDATESNYRRFGPRAEIVHLGCHGVVNRDDPEYSSIVLAPGDGEREDAYLQAYEIAEIRLEHRPLVILAACEVAGGRVSAAEGLMGLTRAFSVAGAGVVVASTWELADSPTADLMESFHALLSESGVRSGEALTRAKRRALASARKPGSARRNGAHPFYWAGLRAFGLDRTAGASAAGERGPSSPGRDDA